MAAQTGRQRRWVAAAVLAVAVSASGCGGGGGPAARKASPSPSSPSVAGGRGEIAVGGRTRGYQLYVPAAVDAPTALLVVLHDGGGTPETVAEATQFDRAAAAAGFAVAYPEGVGRTWNAGWCCGTAGVNGVDDVAFLAALVDRLSTELGVGRDRTFAAGVSNGAIMAYRLACDLPDRFAAVASVAGTMLLDGCTPSTAVSVLEIHGTADPVVPYDGGALPDFAAANAPAPPIRSVVERWATIDGCPDPPATRQEANMATLEWTGCRDGTAVKLVTVQGGGHTWYAPEFGPVDGAVDATAAIVGFFALGLPER